MSMSFPALSVPTDGRGGDPVLGCLRLDLGVVNEVFVFAACGDNLVLHDLCFWLGAVCPHFMWHVLSHLSDRLDPAACGLHLCQYRLYCGWRSTLDSFAPSSRWSSTLLHHRFFLWRHLRLLWGEQLLERGQRFLRCVHRDSEFGSAQDSIPAYHVILPGPLGWLP